MFIVRKRGINWIAFGKMTVFLWKLITEKKLIEADVPCKYSAEYASVMCRGKAKILQNAADKCAALRILMRAQTGEEHEINEKMVNAVCVIEINVDSYTAKACVK